MSCGSNETRCGDRDLTLTQPLNAPGLPAFDFRLGTHGDFMARMLDEISRKSFPKTDLATQDSTETFGAPPLAVLSTRDASDPAIALIDSWAVVADILSFYQERIANEGFLRTAVERRSVLELARSIGYELNPGSSATAYLAFTVEDAPGSPGTVELPKGTKVQSVPQKRELPQTFETSSDFTAQAEWNTLRPRMTHPQLLITTQPNVVYIAQPDPDIKVGSNVLVAVTDEHGKVQPKVRIVTDVSYDVDSKLTRVDLLDGDPPSVPQSPPIPAKVELNFLEVRTVFQAYTTILGKTVRESDLRAYSKNYNLSAKRLVQHAQELRYVQTVAPAAAAAPAKAHLDPPQAGLYAFKGSCGVFGSNAPLWDVLPSTLKVSVGADGKPTNPNTAPYQVSWEDNNIHKAGNKTDLADNVIRLERTVPEAIFGTWIVLVPEAGLSGAKIVRIASSNEQALADYAMSGKSTTVELRDFDDLDGATANPVTWGNFGFRKTRILAGSHQIDLPQLPLTTDLGKDTPEASQITLDELVLGLEIGQPVIIEGDDAELKGTQSTELLFIKEIVHSDNLTTLYFTTAMTHKYVRATTKLSANVVASTHGETVAGEVLGSGDGTTPNQKFQLKKPPLAYVPAQTPTGSQTTLEVRVNNILWHEVPRLFGQGLGDRVYQVRLTDEGKVNVIFGDGWFGTRIPTGLENVSATYRSGGGSPGRVKAELLTLLPQRPLGLRSVRNPLDADGGVDPQDRDGARKAAPLTILTLERVISRKDVEDMARGFAGIGKAKAIEIRRGERLWVLLSIAGVDGNPLPETADTRKFLDASLRKYADPALNLRLETFVPRLFGVAANLLIDPDRVRADVEEAVRAKLESIFAFEARDFGEGVSVAEIDAAIQKVDGVIACQVTTLKRIGIANEPEFSATIPAAKATWDTNVHPAELLTISPPYIVFGEMTP